MMRDYKKSWSALWYERKAKIQTYILLAATLLVGILSTRVLAATLLRASLAACRKPQPAAIAVGFDPFPLVTAQSFFATRACPLDVGNLGEDMF